MKRVRVYQQILSEENLRLAIQEVCRSHRRNGDHSLNKKVLNIEANLDDYVKELRKFIEDLVSGDAHMNKPIKRRRWDRNGDNGRGKWRDINEPLLWPDQCVHHAALQVMIPHIMRSMDRYCIASVPGRGNSYGVKALKKWMGNDPVGTKYAFECDIYHCFEELDPVYVINALKRLFKDRETLWLCDAMMEYGVLIGAFFSAWFLHLTLQPLVPADARQEISARIKEELAAEQETAERERKYTALRVRENGTDQFFQIGQRKTLLDLGRFLRKYLEDGGAFGAEALRKSFSDLAPVSAEQYSQLMESRLENPNKVTNVHELDFDKHMASTVAIERDWRTYSMKDISAAVYFAFRKSGLGPFQHEARFENKLIGKERPSAGHLSSKEISFAEEICEMDGHRLNFYLETSFDVDVVFGTHVCTAENDDTLNVYADYDMATEQVCDELEVDLHRADGREESVEYRLNAIEKATLLWKMEAYCQHQTGQSLKDYSAGLMAEEEIMPPAGPAL